MPWQERRRRHNDRRAPHGDIRLTVPPAEFLARVGEPARAIASALGLIFKLWGLDTDIGLATSSYLFCDRAAADAFAAGPMIDTLRNGPATEVLVRVAPVNSDLSRITHAGFVIDAAAKAIPARAG